MSNLRVRVTAASVIFGIALVVSAIPASAHNEKKSTTITFSASITSTQTVLDYTGVNNSITYGWNLLVGTTTIDGVVSDIQMLGSVDYYEGSGPFNGFLTITQPDASLALRMNGKARAVSDRDSFSSGTETKFKSTLEVIGGEGRFLEVKGRGVWTGDRKASLGGAVTMKVKLKLSGISD